MKDEEKILLPFYIYPHTASRVMRWRESKWRRQKKEKFSDLSSFESHSRHYHHTPLLKPFPSFLLILLMISCCCCFVQLTFFLLGKVSSYRSSWLLLCKTHKQRTLMIKVDAPKKGERDENTYTSVYVTSVRGKLRKAKEKFKWRKKGGWWILLWERWYTTHIERTKWIKTRLIEKSSPARVCHPLNP